MALGGGTFTTQDKILPGAYINFISLENASALTSERGIVTMALELDWGVENEVFEVSETDFRENCLKIFGYYNNDDKKVVSFVKLCVDINNTACNGDIIEYT